MAILEHRLLVICILFALSRFSDESKVQSTSGANNSQSDVINIDDNWLHGRTKEGRTKPQVKVIIDREHVTGYKRETDDEDDEIIDGSGSGQKEITEDSIPDVVLSAIKINDTNFVVQEGGTEEISGNENQTKEKQVKIKATKIPAKDKKKAKEEEDTNVLNVAEIKEGGAEEVVEKNPCAEIECEFGAACTQNGMDTYECLCPVTSCNEQPGNPICGSDGQTYANQCELEQTMCKEQANISIVKYTECNAEMEICPERTAAKWSSWSMWFASGHSEFRVRFCLSLDGTSEVQGVCKGKSIEWRQCKINEEKTCISPFGEKKKQKTSVCSGVNVNDIHSMKTFFPEWKEKGEICRFSVYDAGDQKFVHSNWTLKKLQSKGDKVLWCNHRGFFIPFTSPYHKCRELLNNFCVKPQTCRYKNRKPLKSRGDIRHKCWKKFLFGQQLPTGFPDVKKYFICQKFADNTDLAKVYGGKDAFYGTLYDTRYRIPLLSFGRFSDLGDQSWPAVPFMIEKGILKKESSILNLFFGKKKSGGMLYKDMSHAHFNERCEKGEQQALDIDYEKSTYHILQLVSPDLIGSDVSKRISTFALTNTVPIHTSVYSVWRKALQSVRKYAVELCGLPLVNNVNTKKTHRKAHNFPDIYIVSGAVPSVNKTIGNGVNVPSLIWMAGCCVRGAEARSFSVYVKNVNNGQIRSAPIEQLEVLLSNMLNSTQTINIFPAYNGICSDAVNDASKYIYV